ncbi:FtsB family cell division protein [Specibacter cremeus]|uniref:FtsB family cell division protein n=1 Tax=Specibacter cremeus TaxID=1629051 RepID=UPI000F7AE662|nr:septum formation initiator family protein [Specibacter cremeus]
MATRRPHVPHAHRPATRTAGTDSTTGTRTGAAANHTPADHPARAPRSGGGTTKGGAAEPVHTPVPARSFSGKLAIVGIAMMALTLMLAPNATTYFRQRAEIAAVEADIAAKTAHQSDLQQQLSRWDDPAFVRQQARDRVSMLMPGETGYWVYGAEGLTDATSTAATNTGAAADPATPLPWTDGLWQAIRKSAAVDVAAARAGSGATATTPAKK